MASKNYVQAHGMEKDKKSPTFADVYYINSAGIQSLLTTLHIDLLSDLGLDDDAVNRLCRGERVTIKLVEDVE